MLICKVLLGLISVGLVLAAQSPRDISDEVKKELEALRTLIQDEILQGHYRLNALNSSFTNYAATVIVRSLVSIQQAAGVARSNINEIWYSAQESGVDAFSCLDSIESQLSELSNSYLAETSDCIDLATSQKSSVIADATYYIDVLYNIVQKIEFNLEKCGAEFLCLSSISDEIEDNMVGIPQRINSELLNVQELFDSWKVNIHMCAETNIAEFVVHSGNVVKEVQDCVDKIVGPNV